MNSSNAAARDAIIDQLQAIDEGQLFPEAKAWMSATGYGGVTRTLMAINMELTLAEQTPSEKKRRLSETTRTELNRISAEAASESQEVKRLVQEFLVEVNKTFE
jgi:hypothetical protein